MTPAQLPAAISSALAAAGLSSSVESCKLAKVQPGEAAVRGRPAGVPYMARVEVVMVVWFGQRGSKSEAS